LRYVGQSWELSVPWAAGGDPVAAFEAAHHRRYGYARPGEPVEIVTLRVRLELPGLAMLPPPPPLVAREQRRSRLVAGTGRVLDAPVLPRFSLVPGEQVLGPVILTQLDATTYVPAGWCAAVGAWGDLEILKAG
jgi:N-methylhydantoinase A/oxoprolinase/acetone carboxylase beta subunit